MRAWACVVAVLLLGGCAASDPPTPATSAPTPTPSSLPTPSPPPSPEPTPTPPGEQPVLPPKTIADQAFDFGTEGDPTGRDPRVRPTDRVPEGYAALVVNVSLQRASAAPTHLPVSGSLHAPTVRVLAPGGQEVLVVDEEGAVESLRTPAVVGVWSVQYEGAGTMRATVLITAFP